MRVLFTCARESFSKLFIFYNAVKALVFSGWCAEAILDLTCVEKIRVTAGYPLFYICCSSCCGLFLLALVLGFVPERLGVEVRKPLKSELVAASKQDAKRPLANSVSHVRGQFLHDNILSDIVVSNDVSFKDSAPFYADKFFLREPEAGFVFFELDLEPSMEALVADSKVAFLSSGSLGEPLSCQGVPLRWRKVRPISGLNLQSIVHGDQFLRKWVKVTDSTKSMFKRSGKYRPIIEKYARRYNLPLELVYAIICAESSFNPEEISNRFAHGLMQVVPKTAGFEVNKWFGLGGLPSPDELLHPETNIKYGTSYLYLLMTRHLSAVKNESSREYCVIAAYNMGVGAMLRIFAETPRDAFEIINKLSSKQVQEYLMKTLPSKETRSFLKKVLGFKESFTVLL